MVSTDAFYLIVGRSHARHEQLQQNRIGPTAPQGLTDFGGVHAIVIGQAQGLGDSGQGGGHNGLIA